MTPRLWAVAWFATLVIPSALHAADVVPLAVSDGHCSCVIDGSYFLVVGSLARDAGPFHVSVTSDVTDAPVELLPPPAARDPDWARRTAEWRGRQDRARQVGAPLEAFPASAQPPRQRTFYLFVGGGDPRSPAGHVAIRGELQSVGRFCQVYVDGDEPLSAALQATVDDIVRTFDTDIFPQAARLGRVVDVDRDGRFTILLTGRLGQLGGGTVALGGCVRGSDFYRDLAAPFGNRCDLMFLNARLQPGPHLHTLLAHEYTHALIFCEHVFGNYLPEQPHVEEEAWLNEGIAHLAEVRHGWSNISHRIDAFLEAPQRYQLVVPDYYAAGLWRSEGHRGATFLFLRWCVEHCGPELVGRLVRSNLSGVANLEAATAEPFTDLFRCWTATLAAGQGSWRPHVEQLPAVGRWQGSLAGTSAAYFLIQPPREGRCRVRVTADAAAALQMTLVPVTP
jgi:hypothetical protein